MHNIKAFITYGSASMKPELDTIEDGNPTCINFRYSVRDVSCPNKAPCKNNYVDARLLSAVAKLSMCVPSPSDGGKLVDVTIKIDFTSFQAP